MAAYFRQLNDVTNGMIYLSPSASKLWSPQGQGLAFLSLPPPVPSTEGTLTPPPPILLLLLSPLLCPPASPHPSPQLSLTPFPHMVLPSLAQNLSLLPLSPSLPCPAQVTGFTPTPFHVPCAARGLLRGPQWSDKVVSTHLLHHSLAASLVPRAPWKAISVTRSAPSMRRAGR